MKHLVFGAGLIGGYLAASLISANQQVSIVARGNVREKLSQGLEITDCFGNSRYFDSLSFVDRSDDNSGSVSQHIQYLWLTVKCTAVSKIVDEIAPLVGKDTVIICLQNGLGSDQLLKQRYPNNSVLRAMASFNVVELKPGHLHKTTDGGLFLETTKVAPNSARALANSIGTPFLSVTAAEEFDALLWAKLQLNLMNSVNALSGIPTKSMLKDRDYRRVISYLMSELLNVVREKKLKLPRITAAPATLIPHFLLLPNFLFRMLAKGMLNIDPTSRMSMWSDLSQGKKTEVEFLNGAVVDEGRKIGIECPVNERIVSLINQEESRSSNERISSVRLLELLRL